MGSMEIGLDQFYNHISWIGGFYESMDRFVCRFANCLDYRVHSVSRGGRFDSPAADLRGHFAHSALRDGRENGLRYSH